MLLLFNLQQHHYYLACGIFAFDIIVPCELFNYLTAAPILVAFVFQKIREQNSANGCLAETEIQVLEEWTGMNENLGNLFRFFFIG